MQRRYLLLNFMRGAQRLQLSVCDVTMRHHGYITNSGDMVTMTLLY